MTTGSSPCAAACSTRWRGQNPCTADGIYTHRWFVVAPENVQALTDMSVQAWKHAGGESNAQNHGQIMRSYKIHVHDDYKPHVKLLRVDD